MITNATVGTLIKHLTRILHNTNRSIFNRIHHLLLNVPDLECIFTIICNLVTKTDSPDEALEMAKLISAKVVQQPNEKPTLRLKM